MSLDFYLILYGEKVFDANITHNLVEMADAAGIYKVLWRPEELGFTKAKQCIPLLEEGLLELVTNRIKYEKFNPTNGWGSYKNFVSFVTEVLTACCDYPNADIEVSR